MADTLIREGVAFGSQPLSPVPQVWDGSTSYAKVQGINGATRVILFNSAGETFINSAPGTVQMVTSAGATNLFSGSNPASVQLTSVSTVSFSGTNTVEVVTSAGGSAYFSGTNPASVQLTATSTVNFSGSGTVAISGTSTVTFSGTESVDISTVPVVGTQANAWSASATVSSGATSNSIDLQYNYQVSYFGFITNTAVESLSLQVSQDNATWVLAEAQTITAGTSSPFHYSTTTAARYARLAISGVSATITATIAGK